MPARKDQPRTAQAAKAKGSAVSQGGTAEPGASGALTVLPSASETVAAGGVVKPIVHLMPYQEEVFDIASRELFLLWARQRGKSHLFGAKALQRMARIRGHSVFMVNASLLMGQENILKEVQIWVSLMDHARKLMDEQGLRLTTAADDDHGNLLDIDALADMFENSKLEARVWHSNTVFSRSRVVAPNPLTARGFTGDVFGDEVGFWPDFEGVYDAVEPIISRSAHFIMWMATTPPADSDHPVFSLLMPSRDDFPVDPRGNWFHTEDGAPVHRVDVRDGEAAGLPLIDKRTKQSVTWQTARARARNTVSFDRNYLLKFFSGGNASIPRHLLLNALAKDSGVAGDMGTLTWDTLA